MADKKLATRAKYEYRVWGKQKKARKLLDTLGYDKTVETIEDCYFLGDDPDWNAKVRDSTLKLKRLVAEEKGFEQWASQWHHKAKSTPAPFDDLFDDLHLDRLSRGKKFSIKKAVKGLEDGHDARPVFVTKHRIRYRVGSVRAEITEITIRDTGDELQTIAIVGDQLDELVVLRKTLGLKGSDNVAVHVAIDAAVEAERAS